MTIAAESPWAAPEAPATTERPHWIDDWRPEDVEFWESKGKKVARRNLIFSIFSEHIGFSVWTMWSTLVLFLGPAYGITPAEKFTIVSVAAAAGSFLRLPYTFAVAKFGGRNWTIFSAGVLLVPTILTFFLLEPGIEYSTLLILAAVAGVGGGNFASSMANINVFYPARLKGRALGLNAAGGNLGVATIQIVGLIILATAGVGHPKMVVGIYIPFIVLSALFSAMYMDNITHATNEKGAMREVCKDSQTWIMSFLYIGTFGSFIGFGFAFGQVLLTQFPADFPTPRDAAEITFIGALIGSIARPIGGMLADKLGGALVTFWNFVGMASFAAIVYVASTQDSLTMFLFGFVGLFITSGIGNGSTYKMIPMIFRAKAQSAVAAGTDSAAADRHARRMSGALIGIAGAVGAFGGVLVNIAFRESFMRNGNGDAAYLSFLIFYGLCFAVTWFVYLRPSEKKLLGV
ncbi:MFS transporter [Sporichthya sp.]|uniref:MFS transporter n=1 Tax=Sporichthya sp. TaxID=65475 RepID=UPI0018215478|nr:nitrate/nitrite transporter [Sporichthya sp.]MBA3742628.1 NarK/NasA family nitrate transporter [Sporichthya sp.]